ncbi:MAG: universal stress protein [Sphingomonadales bacterium]|nr:universal stress protein [Sphingomonadales bacterium]
MTIRLILAPVLENAASEPAIAAAITLAKAFDAQVAGMHIRPDPERELSYLEGYLKGPARKGLVAKMNSHWSSQAESAAHSFKMLCKKQSVSFAEKPSGKPGLGASWNERVGSLRDVISAIGRSADVVVIGRPKGAAGGNGSKVIRDAVLATGKPVIVIPEDGFERIGRNVVVAWNCGAEAARAVGAALPILRRAARVCIISAGGAMENGPSAAELSNYLKLHGVEAGVAWIKDKNRTPQDILLDKASELDADLIVMGAYSHRGLPERATGSFTQAILTHADIPVLLVH